MWDVPGTSLGYFCYQNLKILERHALCISFRIKLPSPTDELTHPTHSYHLETLRLKIAQQRFDNGHVLLFETIYTTTIQNSSNISNPSLLVLLLFAIQIHHTSRSTRLRPFHLLPHSNHSAIYHTIIFSTVISQYYCPYYLLPSRL